MDQKPSPTPPQTPAIISTDKIIEVNPSKDIWLQQSGESDSDYAKFLIYQGLGPTRSLKAANEKYTGRALKNIAGNWKEAAYGWNWAERAQAGDKAAQQRALDTNSNYRHQAETNTEAAIARITQILKECVEEEDEEKYQKYAKKLNLLILGTGRAAEVLFKAHRCLFGERQHIESTHSFKTVVMEFE